MATVGLKGVWGLEQLDKTGLATWKLGLILMGVASVVGYILTKLLSGMDPNPVLGPMSPQLIAGYAFGLAFGAAALLVVPLALTRAIEVDLRVLASFDDAVEASIERLESRRALRFTCLIIGILYGYIIYPVLISLVHPLNLTVVEAFIALATGGPYLICAFVLLPLLQLIVGMGVALTISQITSLAHAARHIKIDFLQLNDYAAIANPGIRLFLCFIPILTMIPLVMLYVDDQIETAFLMRGLLVGVFMAALTLLPYIYPVWILRNRIKDKKIAEMGQITLALRGDDDAMSKISIQGRGAPVTTVDLLMHQMFIESRWEWPIASHLQKLILFGLLPPLTWVVAAMIENAMY